MLSLIVLVPVVRIPPERGEEKVCVFVECVINFFMLAMSLFFFLQAGLNSCLCPLTQSLRVIRVLPPTRAASVLPFFVADGVLKVGTAVLQCTVAVADTGCWHKQTPGGGRRETTGVADDS